MINTYTRCRDESAPKVRSLYGEYKRARSQVHDLAIWLHALAEGDTVVTRSRSRSRLRLAVTMVARQNLKIHNY